MRITFLVPPLNASGGNKVVARYATLLGKLGHEVVVTAPRHALLQHLRRIGRHKQASAHFDFQGIDVRIVKRFGHVLSDDVPDADVVLATWWETAEWVACFGQRKGRGFYFVQGHEIYPWLPQDRTRATYRLPLQKIVISRWLADIMKAEYGDETAVIVPNGVDHAAFNAPSRGKQHRPTVGMLYSTVPLKGVDTALDAVTKIHRNMADLRVLVFGLDEPDRRFPDFIEFTKDPAPSRLRDIYRSCDVWLSASRSEGFNLPTMEAMACRTPVVATRTGWPAEAVSNGLNGACVDVDDAVGLAVETERLLRLSNSEWMAVSENAFETVRDCSWERSAELFVQALLLHSAERPAVPTRG